MRTVYWVSAFVVLYVYAGYPLLLAAWASVRRRRSLRRRAVADLASFPSISIVVAARNEAHRLKARLDNLLGLDYPASRRQIVVVSDGSTDDTAQVLEEYRERATVVLLPAPRGKAAALNAGVEAAAGEVLVFADARQQFAADALRRLVAPFADPRIGGVSGELLIDAGLARTGAEGDTPVGEGVGLYWGYEKWLRQRESEVASTLGATGAIYALRREVWRPLPPETLLDDVLAPMRCVLDGYRVVFEAGAKAYDRSSADAETELRRKTRTLAGNFQLLRLEPRLLVPGVNPVWLQFVSHKLGRLLVPYALAALLVSNTLLAHVSLFYGLTLVLQVAFYVLALHGAAIALDVPADGQTPAGRRPGREASTGGFTPTPGRDKGAGECAA